MKTIRCLLAGFCALTFLTFPLVAATVARPTLIITSPLAGQLLSNDTFTVTGTAASSASGASVTNVFFSLNKSASWGNAESDNNWTSWSEEITLIPGTNIFSAYALGTNGVRSLTNTVKFVYYLTGVLTVATNGSGTISPAYNGKQLELGAIYSMTATSTLGRKATGSGFRNWTDGSNNIVSTSATLKFMMVSNLTLTANFGNIRPPSIDVISSTTNSDGVANDFIIRGVAKDDQGVTNVIYNMNGGAWQNATTTNAWKNWNAAVSLVPGANVFSAYAIDISSNFSPLLTATLIYNTAPMNLSGKLAVVIDNADSSASSTIAFSKSTFSQTASDTNNFNAVGSYTYSDGGGGGNATLKYKFTGPPSVAHVGSQSVVLFFNTPTYAYFTNITAKTDGYMYFSTASNLAPASASGQLIWTIGNNAGDGHGAIFQKSTYTSQALLSGDTNGGKYTYTKSSPVGVLFKLNRASGTAYLLATYADTNHGSYYEEDYDSVGHTNGTDTGNFFIASQTPGGNAPVAITNRNFEIFSGQDSFNVQLGANTYSQTSLTTNFDNDVGDYTYTNMDTNVGQLKLTVTAPPADATNDVLAGNTSAARLVFVNSSSGFFTNDDSTFSSFVMTTVTNLAPSLIASNTLNLTYISGYYLGIFPQYATNQFQFDTNGNFTFDGSPSGTYVYQPFSPTVAMVQFNFTTNGVSTNGTELDWLQLNFSTTNSGSYFDNQFDTETNFLGNISGSFFLQ